MEPLFELLGREFLPFAMSSLEACNRENVYSYLEIMRKGPTEKSVLPENIETGPCHKVLVTSPCLYLDQALPEANCLWIFSLVSQHISF